MTIRERVKAINAELRDGDVTPQMAREHLVTLTALMGNIHDEVRDSELDYKQVLLSALQSETKANRARMVAECSPEYRRHREAKDTATQVQELIRTCRAYLRSLDEEMRLAR